MMEVLNPTLHHKPYTLQKQKQYIHILIKTSSLKSPVPGGT
jgi:hypothetical protein